MANEKNISGDLGNLAYYDGDDYVPIVCLTSSSFTSTMEMLEKVNMCNPGRTVRSPGNIDQSVDIEGEVIDTSDLGGNDIKASFDELLALQKDMQENKEPELFRLSRGPLGYKYFEGYISDLNDSYVAGDDATFSATLTVEGDVSEEDPNAVSGD